MSKLAEVMSKKVGKLWKRKNVIKDRKWNGTAQKDQKIGCQKLQIFDTN